MKYWFFNGSDVVGPYSPKELVADKSFNAASLICPEFFSDEEDHWQPAQTFAELQPWLVPNETDEAATLTLEEEMDTLLHEKFPLSFEKTTTDSPGLQLPQKPAKPGPIEDYFNNIQTNDLGDILGIPAPADNSDMDLAHALEKQLAKTSSTRRKERELSDADEQTVQNLQPDSEITEAAQTHHVATATEVFATQIPAAQTAVLERPTEEPVPENSLPPLPADEGLHMPTTDTAPVTAPMPKVPTLEAGSAVRPTADTAPLSPAGQTQPQEQPQFIENPAQLRAEDIEVNSIKTHLKQTQEMKDVVDRTQRAHTRPAGFWERKAMVFLLATVAIVGSIFIIQRFHTQPVQAATAAPQTENAERTTAQELLEQPPLVHTPAAVIPPADNQQQALAIVQNYPLSGARGTIAGYLNRLYQTQLAQGYTAAWEAEPLHKNTYLVKYRLTKTRKEPIIYIFQADVAAGKLTGALNNVSLDLVGKIQQ